MNELVLKRDLLPRKERPSFLVTGFTGRKKGPLGGKQVGSLPLLAAGQFFLPNIIVKNKEGPIVDRPRLFVACIKDLDTTMPYEVSLDLLKPGLGDKLIVLHIVDAKVGATAAGARKAKGKKKQAAVRGGHQSPASAPPRLHASRGFAAFLLHLPTHRNLSIRMPSF